MKNYNFKVGDKVVTTEGETGVIVGICTCEMCEKRGFHELTWVRDGDDHIYDYITNYDAENNFKGYYQIGLYYFDKFDKDSVINQIVKHEMAIFKLKTQLRNIRKMEEENNVN